MGLRGIWGRYKVLIVMGTSLGLIHWGWYNLKTHPALYKPKDQFRTGPAFVSPPAPAKNK